MDLYLRTGYVCCVCGLSICLGDLPFAIERSGELVCGFCWESESLEEDEEEEEEEELD